ncbi:MAG: hypothetical protein JWM74_2626 [Myxococcaceae bacterium]|nr:hypothetical protein [Myxococcaceae bacterium]
MTMARIIGAIAGVEEYSRSVWIIASTPAPVQGEALTSWDWSRFVKNPVILWGHDDSCLPIGLASSIEFIPGTGLKMLVTFAREAANPLAEQVWQGVRDGIVRAVSVGYDPPQERTRDVPGEDGTIAKVTERSAALLVEVSFVAIGADEDAGTEFLNPEAVPDEVLKARVSKAASDLAKARVRIAKKIKAAAPKNIVGGDDSGTGDTVDPGAKPLLVTKPLEGQPAGGMPDKITTPALPPVIGASKQPAEKMDSSIAGIERLDAGEVLRLDRSRLDSSKIERTSIGGAYIPARLSRTGVLLYRNPDGSQRRELRTAEEVFKADSLATLVDVPVIDIADHTKIHDPTTWRKIARGHVTSAKREDKYVTSRLAIQDQETLDAIDNGERTEISCGYRCVLDMTPGVTDSGEPYDCIQRNIRYNHAALCPPNRGRAGPDVGLRLDGTNTAPSWSTTNIDTIEGDTVMKIRFNGKEYEAGSTEHMDAVEATTKSTVEQVKLDAKAHLDSVLAEHKTALALVVARADKAEGERDSAKEALDKFNADAKKAKEDEDKNADKNAQAAKQKKRMRRQLERAALRFFTDEEEGDDEKMDAADGADKVSKIEERIDSMSDRELMLHCLKKHNAKFDATDRSDDYIAARFDSMVETLKVDRGIAGVVKAARAGVQNLDAGDDDEVTAARKKRDEEARDAWKKPVKTG